MVRLWMSVWATFLVVGFAAGNSALAAEVSGVFNVVKGDVKVKSGKTGETTVAKIGSKVFPKDTIITGKDSRAKVVMVDKNVINVNPETQIVFQNYEYAPEQGKKDVLLNVIYGKVRSKVEQKYDGKDAKFQVKTPAAVAGVRGTDFLAGYSPKTQRSEIVTFEGKVEFGTPGPGGKIENPVFVAAGQTAQAAGGGAPSAPEPMSKESLAQMDKESNADTSKGPGTSEDRAPAKDSEKKEDGDKKDEGDKKDGASTDKQEGDKSADNNGGGNDGGMKDGNADKDNGSGNNDKQAGPGEGGKKDGPGGGSAPNGGSAGGSSASNGPGGSGGSMPGPGGPVATDRGPAGAGGAPMGGSGMMLPTDVAVSPGVAPIVPVIPVFNPPPIPTSGLFGPCDTCRAIIENGTTQLIIRVNK